MGTSTDRLQSICDRYNFAVRSLRKIALASPDTSSAELIEFAREVLDHMSYVRGEDEDDN